MSTAGPVIATRVLTKRYGDVTAVDGVAVQVEPGEIYALLGLNGAGKTTLIRMLLGLVRPTSGGATILGHQVRPMARTLWAEVGYLVETPSAYPELTVTENLELTWRLRQLTDRSRITTVIDQLGLAPYAHRRAGHLSLGNAQRLGLAKALIHRPQVLLLDEPANALDPAGVAEIRDLLHDLADHHGVTILISSHILSEVARLAGRIGIIHHGRLIEELDTGQLAGRLRQHLIVSTKDNEAAVTALAAAGYPTEHSDPLTLIIDDPAAIDHPDAIATVLVTAGCPPTQLTVWTEDLESYFLRLIEPARSNT